MFSASSRHCPSLAGKVAGAAGRDEPESAVAIAGKAGRGQPAISGDLRLVHRGIQHRGPQRGQGVVGGTGIKVESGV
jgi:hypothetical protein